MWRTITEAEIEDSMHKHEIDTVRESYLADGQDDPVPAVLSQVVLEVREAIRSCDHNVLHPTATYLPDGAIGHAISIIRHRLLARLDIEVSDARRDDYRTAQKYLTDVASCARAVERYGADEDDPRPVLIPAINARTKRFTRDQQDGI